MALDNATKLCTRIKQPVRFKSDDTYDQITHRKLAGSHHALKDPKIVQQNKSKNSSGPRTENQLAGKQSP
jgi:hypothetical protein